MYCEESLMGKNAGFKAQQASRHTASDAAPATEGAADGMVRSSLAFSAITVLQHSSDELRDSLLQVDASFHTAEWHAARLASLHVSYWLMLANCA